MAEQTLQNESTYRPKYPNDEPQGERRVRIDTPNSHRDVRHSIRRACVPHKPYDTTVQRATRAKPRDYPILPVTSVMSSTLVILGTQPLPKNPAAPMQTTVRRPTVPL